MKVNRPGGSKLGQEIPGGGRSTRGYIYISISIYIYIWERESDLLQALSDSLTFVSFGFLTEGTLICAREGVGSGILMEQ